MAISLRLLLAWRSGLGWVFLHSRNPVNRLLTCSRPSFRVRCLWKLLYQSRNLLESTSYRFHWDNWFGGQAIKAGHWIAHVWLHLGGGILDSSLQRCRAASMACVSKRILCSGPDHDHPCSHCRLFRNTGYTPYFNSRLTLWVGS